MRPGICRLLVESWRIGFTSRAQELSSDDRQHEYAEDQGQCRPEKFPIQASQATLERW
jgi:hypothetical protein